MSNREAFRKKLDETFLPSNMVQEKQDVLLNELQSISDSLMPQRLYRFRRCDEMSISAFERDELWATTPNKMNDGFDTRPYIDREELNARINMIKSGTISKDLFISRMDVFDRTPINTELLMSKLKSISNEEFESVISQVVEFITNDMLATSTFIPGIAQQSFKICCFSENIDSPYMWGQYSENETGFALEYSFDDKPYVEPLLRGKQRNAFLFPVVYGEERYHINTEYIMYLLNYRLVYLAFANLGMVGEQWVHNYISCPDILLPTKISLYKSSLWGHEAEWRLFCTSVDDREFNNSNYGCCTKMPTGIYLGRRISQINEKILRILAQERNIPVYKMKLDDKYPTYKLIV